MLAASLARCATDSNISHCSSHAAAVLYASAPDSCRDSCAQHQSPSDSVRSRHEPAASAAAQVKCVSFLTWLLRGYPAAIIAHRVSVTDALVHLLRTAPDVVAIRKELLVAMRNTLTLQQVRE